jgi:hypothetical protein
MSREEEEEEEHFYRDIQPAQRAFCGKERIQK